MITLFLFVKGTAASPVEGLVAQAQVAAALDTLERLRRIPEIDQFIVATASRELADSARQLGAIIDIDSSDAFHFGRRLASLVQKYGAATPLYVGGGSGVLMQDSDWAGMIRDMLSDSTVVTNNYFSCDFAAWTPGSKILHIDPPTIDNDLAYCLGERAGLRVVTLAKNAATQLDIDTPSDLVSVSFDSRLGPRLKEWLKTRALDVGRARRIRKLMTNPRVTLLIAGRVSASMALFLERETRCQWRIFSEERGMRASGREERGDVRSLLGYYFDLVGEQRFFESLANLSDGAVIDTRVLFAHRSLHPSAPDRYHSDLLESDRIADPFVRALTSAARQSPIPVLLGGHSIVSGGMYALAQHNPESPA